MGRHYNDIGQALLAKVKHLGKIWISAETEAGQHGVVLDKITSM
jgi:tryptophan synthase beta subunit